MHEKSGPAAGLNNEADKPICTGSSKRKCILHVDDDELILDTSKLILEHLGFDVVGTTCSVDAVNVFQSRMEEFDIVITDLRMPLMNGLQLSEILLAKRPDIPIILCTATPESINENELKNIGIKAIIPKPFSIKKAARIIHEIIS
jgi:CheY-like chemotaxis protein